MEKINLINKKGKRIGLMDKLETHKTGKLHEAFSVFIFNDKKQILLQKRNKNKYHSGGLWSNTCCSHTKESEILEKAVHRRLLEEMGFDCKLVKLYSFLYKIKFLNGLIENELDYVYIGFKNAKPKPDYSEVSDWKWIDLRDLVGDIKLNPNNYSFWLKKIIDDKKIINYIAKMHNI